MAQIREVTSYLESLAPLGSQESYDNCGLIVGDSSLEISGVLVSLDCIEQTVEEAIGLGCNFRVYDFKNTFFSSKLNFLERKIVFSFF